jgi:hypothetical protein
VHCTHLRAALLDIHTIWEHHNEVLATKMLRPVLKVVKNSVVPFLTRHLCHTATTATAAWAIHSATDSREPPVVPTTHVGHTAIVRAACSWANRCSMSDWMYIYFNLNLPQFFTLSYLNLYHMLTAYGLLTTVTFRHTTWQLKRNLHFNKQCNVSLNAQSLCLNHKTLSGSGHLK